MIDEIKARVNIIGLANNLGCDVTSYGFMKSIYRKENIPSLKFYKETNSYYCFATGQGGDVINFYADFFNIELKQAIRELAEKYAIIYKEDAFVSKTKLINKVEKQSNKYYLLKREKEFFDETVLEYENNSGLTRDEAKLRAWDKLLKQREKRQLLVFEALEKFSDGLDDKSLEYLMGNKRGLTLNTIKKFRLFSIKNLEKTNSFLKDNYSISDLIISGIFTLQEKFIFSSHRIIIPFIEDGKIVSLRGRYFLSGQDKPYKIGKYIGLHNFSTNLTAKRFFNRDILSSLPIGSNLIVCEGEFDCMIADQVGENAIGISGVTNFPQNGIEQLKDFEIYLSFDNDIAGKEATQKIGKLFNRNVKVIKLKNHKDITGLLTNEKQEKKYY